MVECDVVVAGAGLAGGLPAAAYLQKAGLDVVLVERGIDTGKFYQSYELHPGVYFDHSPVNFSCISPAMLDLDLESVGYRIVLPDILHSVMDTNGHAMTFYPDGAKTIAQLKQFSSNDADRFQRILQRLNLHWAELLKTIFFSPHPDIAQYERALALSADALEWSVGELARTNGIELLERLFESEQTRIFLIPLPALNLFGDLTVPGQGALSWLWALLLRACIAPAGNQSLVRAVERVFLKHGGRLLRNTEVDSLVVRNDRCQGVTVKASTTGQGEPIVARRATISNLGASMTLKLLGQTKLPEEFANQLGRWSTAKRVLATHDFILRQPPRWKSAESNPDVARSQRIYLVWNTWRECVDWLKNSYTDEATFHGDVELTLFNNIYGSADDKYALRVRHGTGPFSKRLESSRERFLQQMLESLAGASEDVARQVIAHQMATPLDYWRSNPVALHGNPVGGDFIEGQWMLDRCPYQTPVDGLYLSNSVWPTALSWLAPGYNAAGVVMTDLGLDRPPWWSHGPEEWFLDYRERARAGQQAGG